MACSSIVLGAPTEKTPEATSTPSEIASFWTPLLSEFPLPGVGGGGGRLAYGYFLEQHILSLV